jgi:hypothetical protein
MNKFYSKIISKETILINTITILHILNLVYFHDSYKSFLISIFLIFVYFFISDRKDKKALALTMINFMIWGVIIESIIIHYTGALEYKNKFLNSYIPLWLIPSYFFFVLGSLNFYNIFKY